MDAPIICIHFTQQGVHVKIGVNFCLMVFIIWLCPYQKIVMDSFLLYIKVLQQVVDALSMSFISYQLCPNYNGFMLIILLFTI